MTGLVRPSSVSSSPMRFPSYGGSDPRWPSSTLIFASCASRFSSDGWVENSDEIDMPLASAGVKKNALNGSALRRSRVGMRAMSPVTFCSADASADGRPVSNAPERSADSSR